MPSAVAFVAKIGHKLKLFLPFLWFGSILFLPGDVFVFFSIPQGLKTEIIMENITYTTTTLLIPIIDTQVTPFNSIEQIKNWLQG